MRRFLFIAAVSAGVAFFLTALHAQCTGSPPFTCSNGGPTCNCGIWNCNGGTACTLPPPPFQAECNNGEGGDSLQCTEGGWQCEPNPGTPIIIDTKGEGYHLTSLTGGVKFRFFPGKPAVQMSWTDPDYSNGFLVLDRDGNGFITDGSEMFGSEAPQPSAAHRNGFAALAVYDLPENGGNGDGLIDSEDAIYSKLRIWIDSNHDGISQPSELHSLSEIGILALGLQYRLDRHIDKFGNQFRYEADLRTVGGATTHRFYDIILIFDKNWAGVSMLPRPHVGSRRPSLSQSVFVSPSIPRAQCLMQSR